MEIMKLLQYEADIYEGIKAGKTITQIAKDINENNGNTFARVKRMIDLGFIKREGVPKKYKYSVVDKPYEVVEFRRSDEVPSFDEDVFLNNLVKVTLSEDKIKELREKKDTMTRTKLAAKLGISKLELNQVMSKYGILQKQRSSN
ncbi:MAG: hypothetical protein K0Q73_8544 [Paenibacillus sp.]|nr:hypothetical protein [Paenibacillus sp.]